MGKRELLLFLGFLAFGAIVYQATSPPKDENKEGFSFSKFVGQIQAEMRGEQAETQVERTASADAPSGDNRLIVPQFRGTLTIIGEDRHDLAAELKATVYGADDDQAKTRANDVTVSLTDKDDSVAVDIGLPKEVRRRPQLDLTLRIPQRLGVTLELRNGTADLRRIGDVQIGNSRGKITMTEVGVVEGSMEMGKLEIVHANGASLKLSRTEARLEEITGELTLEADHGELRMQQLHGPGKLTLQRLDCEIDAVHAPLRIEPDHVGLSVRNVSAPLTIRGERTGVTATLDAAVEVTIDTTDDLIDLRTPNDGVTIDARTENGQIRVADTGSAVDTTARKHDEEDDQLERPDSDSKEKQKDKSEKAEKAEPREFERPERRERSERRDRSEFPQPPEPPAPPAPGAPRAPMPSMPIPMPRSGQHRGDNNSDSQVKRVNLKLHGGGPQITLRNLRGDIVIR